MRNNMETTIKKMKSGSIIGQIALFVLSLCGSAIVVAMVIVALTAVSMNSRFSEAFFTTNKTVERIKADIENGKDYNKVLELIQIEEKRPLAISIANKKDNVIAHYGEAANLKTAKIFNYDEEPFVQISLESVPDDSDLEENEIRINMPNMVREFYESTRGLNENATQVFQDELFTYNYWIKSPINDDYTAYTKNELVIYGKDCAIAIAIAAILGVVFVISSFAGLFRTIGNIISQRYYLRLLLSDPITGGNNEFAFEQNAFKNITHIIYKKSGFAIVDLSLEKYQNYCTLYGVDEGEKLLKGIESILKSNLHSGETVSRVSGGNYLLLLRTDKISIDEKGLAGRAKAIVDSLPEKLAAIDKDNSSLSGLGNIHLKAGMYYIPPVINEDAKKRRDKKTLSIKNLCIKAGMAKGAITEDSGFMVYNHDMWEKEIWESKVEDMMEEALINEEFQVYIQPKYHPATEELLGGEALVRWISPTEGFISPGQFIPIFERTGFVTKLDDYMIAHTAKLQSEWLAAGKEIVPISVNVSRAHFAKPDLAEHIRDLVAQYPLPNKYIEIELTESAFFDDKNALLTTVHKLQEYGFEVSMDDFGSGYSSLNSLKDLPLNVLKLDAEFFRGEDFGGRGEIVVSEAISLAKKLDMRIVAEGVEKKEQVDFLAGQNCDMIQGYYFAKPMPANEYEERMK
ncbi:MAG: EAL domain-containing protein [Lachnospiraceae bacterium]|nr:EAL domain-containing protein [Candidatus Colinaster scatohippi]